MPITDTLKKIIPSAAPKAPAIGTKLDAARAAFEATEHAFTQAALAQAMDEPGAVERVTALKAERAALSEKIADLERAYGAATQADTAAAKAQRAAIYASQLRAIKKSLKERDTEAVALSNALQDVATHWQLMWSAGRRAMRACPTGIGRFPEPSLILEKQLCEAAWKELWRLTGRTPGAVVGDDHAPAFAGIEPKGTIQSGPHHMPIFLDDVARASAFIIRELEAKEPPSLADMERAQQRGMEPGTGDYVTQSRAEDAERIRREREASGWKGPPTDYPAWLAMQPENSGAPPAEPASGDIPKSPPNDSPVVRDAASAPAAPPTSPEPGKMSELPEHVARAKQIVNEQMANPGSHTEAEVADAMSTLARF